MRFMLLLLFSFILSSCTGGPLAGEYKCGDGGIVSKLNFRNDGIAVMTLGRGEKATTQENPYKVEGDKVIINISNSGFGPTYTRSGRALIGGFGLTTVGGVSIDDRQTCTKE